MKRFPGSTRCHVEEHYGAWIVTFYRGREASNLLLQTDYDRASFAVSCGAVKAPHDWDGRPSKLPDPQEFYGLDCSTIEYCSDEYRDIADVVYK